MDEYEENQIEQDDADFAEEPILDSARPRWQRIGAGILAALLIVGIIGYYYWIMYRY